MILQGDALEELRKLPDKCCSVCVTSPPYYNARKRQRQTGKISRVCFSTQ